jgi:hypothetical protein
LFVNNIVGSLARIGLLPSSSSENRMLAVELAELVVRWEELRVAGRRSFRRVALPSVAKVADTEVCFFLFSYFLLCVYRFFFFFS